MLGQAQHLLLGYPRPCLHWAGGPTPASNQPQFWLPKAHTAPSCPRQSCTLKVLPRRAPAVGTLRGTSFTSKPVTTPDTHRLANTVTPQNEHYQGPTPLPSWPGDMVTPQTAEGKISKPVGRDSPERKLHSRSALRIGEKQLQDSERKASGQAGSKDSHPKQCRPYLPRGAPSCTLAE